MTPDLDALVAFLRARLDEREHRVRELRRRAQENRRAVREPAVLGTHVPGWHDWPDVEQECAAALADVDAHRWIVDLHRCAGSYPTGDSDGPRESYCSECGSGEPYEYPAAWPCQTIRLLALPHSSHPDYREVWRPDPSDAETHGS